MMHRGGGESGGHVGLVPRGRQRCGIFPGHVPRGGRERGAQRATRFGPNVGGDDGRNIPLPALVFFSRPPTPISYPTASLMPRKNFDHNCNQQFNPFTHIHVIQIEREPPAFDPKSCLVLHNMRQKGGSPFLILHSPRRSFPSSPARSGSLAGDCGPCFI